MSNRRGLAEDLLSFALKLPPLAAVALAIITWMIFYVVASQTVVAGSRPGVGGIAANDLQWFIHLAALFLEFSIPFCLLVGALASAIRRRQARRIFAISRDKPKTAISSMRWRDFERLVGESFREQGFGVFELGGHGPDGGVDLVLTKDGRRYLAQCKHWKKFVVGVSVVRELNGVIAAQEAQGGYVVTAGRFTHDAITFADSCGIVLIDGSKLDAMIGSRSLALRKANARCPECGSQMSERLAGKGRFRGQPFWGCIRYPKCRGKLHIDPIG